jgi:putative transcriptional regulator
MTIRHHLSEPLLMAYSAGHLPEAFSLVIATHLSMCDDCRARLGAYDAVGGALLDQCENIQMGQDSLAATLARLGTPLNDAPTKRRDPLFPAPLVDYVGGDLNAVKWRPLGMGVRQAILPTGKRANARLLYIPAGREMPDHGHRGMELTLVLQGAFRDEKDRFGVGDVEIADEDMNHRPMAEDGVDCICLTATDAPLRFTSMLPRLAQRFLRI